ncbi:MAG: hypothetical protein HYU80_00925 [Candidatus Blackburnbacteria bacterium]|nr:hypothetical protein [Candidatus Blackburnbacteria bacterium]
MKQIIKNYSIEILLTTFALIFSTWLMWHTFSYENGSMLIAAKAWSDFASHIPLIRSFSLGNNFPPEYPIFPGEPIRYHFLFYLFVGLLEKIGLRIDWALNVPSVLSFTLLILSIYLLAKFLFKSRAVAILSVIFFLFNGSLSFVEFFKTHPISLLTPKEIFTNTEFPAFFPYIRSSLITGGFWNLNVFTNQRHLASALTFFLFLFLFIHKKTESKKFKLKHAMLCGIGLGLLPFWNGAVFVMAMVVLSSYSLFWGKKDFIRLCVLVLIGLCITFPQIFLIRGEGSKSSLELIPGYLINSQLSPQMFSKFWILNLGLGLVLMPIGFLLTTRKNRRVFLSFGALFIFANLFKMTPDIAANHKFFNLFITVGNMFSANAIILLLKRWPLFHILLPLVALTLILSGIIDFFAIKNDRLIEVIDYSKQPDANWILKNTPRNSVFLNSSFIYHPASLVGRKIFLGWPYFAWSAGYDTDTRFQEIKDVYVSSNKHDVCTFLRNKKIDFIETQPRYSKEEFPISFSLFEKNFHLVYKNQISGLRIYNTKTSCNNVY